MESDTLRATAYEPTAITEAVVTDLNTNAGGCVGPYILYWSYTNPGDLDHNSEVNISDLTVLGASLNQSYQDADWTQHSWADADGNGMANISDLCVVGANLGSRVDGYAVEYSEDETEWTELGRVALTEIGSEDESLHDYFYDFLPGMLSFEPADGLLYEEFSFRVRAYRDEQLGAPSDPLRLDYPEMPHGLTASQGTSAEGVWLQWQNPDNFEVLLLRADSPDGEYAPLTWLTFEEFLDDSVVPGQHYWYELYWDGGGGLYGSYTVSTDIEGWSDPAAEL